MAGEFDFDEAAHQRRVEQAIGRSDCGELARWVDGIADHVAAAHGCSGAGHTLHLVAGRLRFFHAGALEVKRRREGTPN